MDTPQVTEPDVDWRELPSVVAAFDLFFVNLVYAASGQYHCPDCARAMPTGYFDYQMSELGPDCVRFAQCFGCGLAIYDSGRIERRS